MKLNHYFTQGLLRHNSPAFLEVAKPVEESILRYLRPSFPLVVNAHVSKMTSGKGKTTTIVDVVLLIGTVDDIKYWSYEHDIAKKMQKWTDDTGLQSLYAESTTDVIVKGEVYRPDRNLLPVGFLKKKRFCTCS